MTNAATLVAGGTAYLLAAAFVAPLADAGQAASVRDDATAAVNTEFLKQTDDIAAVTQIVLRERQARDRAWWEQMASTYWPDSRVDLSWYHGDGPGFVAGSKTMYERGAQPVHRMFAPVVDMRGSKAHVEAPTLTWSTLEIDGKQANFHTSMRLNYRLEKRSGEWRILSMAPVYEYATVDPAVPGEAIAIPAAELKPFRTSYAILSWNMAQRGYKLSQDELGVDRPEQLKAFYDAIKKWLNE